MTTPSRPDEDFARRLDAADPLAPFRAEFLIPPGPDGNASVYLCGHSLGLQPRAVRALLQQELDDWANLGVEGHFRGRTPWYSYHETLRESGARLVGALPGEVVFMNSLTVNLHLMMITFYRPASRKRGILIDEPAFPSDRYAVHSQIRHHGLDPDEALFPLTPREGEDTLREEDVEAFLDARGEEVALVLFNGVNFVTGQLFDLARITAAAHRHGCLAGFDLAHAAGNVPLALHEWGVDFAVWCSYKYLNAGPGAVGGCFVHEQHGNNLDLTRLAGWWGNDPATRFHMQSERTFRPRPGTDGWQLSNPPILAMAPLRTSLDLFDRASMTALREKSQRLTGYLLDLLDTLPSGAVEILTPRGPEQHGCQVSLRIRGDAGALVQRLHQRGIVCDHREPGVLRVAPVPLYNTFHDVWAFAHTLAELIGR
jgi:kynureninase